MIPNYQHQQQQEQQQHHHQQEQQQQQPQSQPQFQPQPQELAKMLSSDAELLSQLAAAQEHQLSRSPREKRVGLITAMGYFRPKNATPIQFYNYVREFCIIHNCSIDEAMERAPDAWTKLGKEQRKLYNSEIHAALPIPVPRHLIYRAFQMERAGRWKISSTPTADGSSATYAVESYAPPMKPTKMQARMRAQQPRYDNLAETSPCCLELPRAPPQRMPAAVAMAMATATAAAAAAAATAATATAASNPAKKTLRTLAPPELRAQRTRQEKSTRSQSLTRIVSAQSLKGRRSVRLKPTVVSVKRLSGGANDQKPQQQQEQQQQKQLQQQLQHQQQQVMCKSKKPMTTATATGAVRTKPISEQKPPKQQQQQQQQQHQQQHQQQQQQQQQQQKQQRPQLQQQPQSQFHEQQLQLLQQPQLQLRASKADLKRKHLTNRKLKKKKS